MRWVTTRTGENGLTQCTTWTKKRGQERGKKGEERTMPEIRGDISDAVKIKVFMYIVSYFPRANRRLSGNNNTCMQASAPPYPPSAYSVPPPQILLPGAPGSLASWNMDFNLI